jgi:hypothetical protein
MMFVFAFEAETKIRLKAFSYIILSLLLTSFWLVPLLMELNFTSHSASFTIDPFDMFIPRDWNCKGICLLNGYYAGLVVFSISVIGLASILLSRRRDAYAKSMIFLFAFWTVFLFGSELIFNLLPIVKNVLQYNARCFVILGFLSCIFITETMDRLSNVRKLGIYVPLILLFLMVIDIYKMTGAPVHSNNEMVTFFSFDGFQQNYERFIGPNEIIPALSYNDSNTIFVSLEPDKIEPGGYFGHQVEPQVAAAIILDRKVAGSFPRESSSNDYHLTYNYATYLAYITEVSLGNSSSLRFAQLMGYLGVDTIVTTSGKHIGNGCMDVLSRTANLYIYNNTCVQPRVSTYKNAVNVVEGDLKGDDLDAAKLDYIEKLFSTDNLDPTKVMLVKSEEPLSGEYGSMFYISPQISGYMDINYYISTYNVNATKPNINVSIFSWEDGTVELQVDAAEEGFVMLRKTAYPDWELSIDGVREEIIRAEPASIAFHIREGKHIVKLVYSYWNWRHLLGFFLSLLALMFISVSIRKTSSKLG